MHDVTVLDVGDPLARPHVHVQGCLHADEGPGMLAARMLAERLTGAEADGRLTGRATVIPATNPPGLGQFVIGDQTGRFDLYDGRTFNRDYPELGPAAAEMLVGSPGTDPAANAPRIRQALSGARDMLVPQDPGDALRLHLMRVALPAGVVLDLHCDGEAEVHLYTQPASLTCLAPLSAHIGCKAVLLAEVWGGIRSTRRCPVPRPTSPRAFPRRRCRRAAPPARLNCAAVRTCRANWQGRTPRRS